MLKRGRLQQILRKSAATLGVVIKAVRLNLINGQGPSAGND